MARCVECASVLSPGSIAKPPHSYLFCAPERGKRSLKFQIDRSLGLLVAAKELHRAGRRASAQELLEAAPFVEAFEAFLDAALVMGRFDAAWRSAVWSAAHQIDSGIEAGVFKPALEQLRKKGGVDWFDRVGRQGASIVRQELGLDVDEFVIGISEPICADEKLDVLLQACAELVKKGERIKLLVVGDRHHAQRVAHCKLLRSLIAENVPWLVCVGSLSITQTCWYQQATDAVVVLDGDRPECNFVSTLIAAEAAAQSKQVLAARGALPEVEAKGAAGLLYFEAGSVSSLALSINDAIRGSQTRNNSASVLADCVSQALKLLGEVQVDLDSTAQRIDGAQQLLAAAREGFYREGRVDRTLDILRDVRSHYGELAKPDRDFESFVAGISRLRDGWELPPRQPNSALLSTRRQVLYCLNQALPHVTNGYATRSQGIAAGLQQSGYHVRAITRPGFPWDSGATNVGKTYHQADVGGVSYTAISGHDIAKTPLDRYLAQAADIFMQEALASNAELIIAASNHTIALPALAAARRLGLPFVYEVRGLWEVTQASNQPKWAGSERFEVMRQLEKQAALEADLVITLTNELADELASWGVRRDRIHIVPNAVNAGMFKPLAPDQRIAKELELEPDVPVIGYAGSAVAYEGLELLLDALAEVRRAGYAFHFVLVGDGKVIETVKERAQAVGIADCCRFTGRVRHDEVPHYLSCMDILPIPRLSSAVTEMVSALKPLEAMAMGKAVLLSDVSPHLTMAGADCARARLFSKDSVESLKNGLIALINDPEARNQLGKAARQWIEQERTWEHVTRRYGDALSALIATPETSEKIYARPAKSLSEITLGLIADKFTTETLANAISHVPLSPNNWRAELSEHHIDAVFIESAWSGNDGQWHRGVGFYSEEEFTRLRELLEYCRIRQIPTLFWNKEDPVHFDRFRPAAALCDHVFTTDSRRIVPYLGTPDAVTKTASSCLFYASPSIHNLLPSSRAWSAKAAYGGTYYGGRYAERTAYMNRIMSAAAPLGLAIYDRQHSDPQSPYKYPSGLGSYVEGGLAYEEMIQAYKAHPVQLNVNSVLDSPTMFSRRVIEVAACGSAMVSGPAVGMNRFLQDSVKVVDSEIEAAEALESLMFNPAHRWRVALKGARAVMRAHTTELRLVQLLRTAGFTINAPQPPGYSVATDRVDSAGADRLLEQTVRPLCVVANKWANGARDKLEQANIACVGYRGAEAEAGTLWLVAAPDALASLEAEDAEDLLWPTQYALHARIGFCRDTVPADGQWPGVAFDGIEIDPALQLVRTDVTCPASELASRASGLDTLALRKPRREFEAPPTREHRKTLLIAGHDLKFIKPFYPYFTKAGWRVLLDFWSGHNAHDEATSQRLLRQADVVFCEWMLGNAIWYAKNRWRGQRLIGRLHLQEIDHRLFSKVPFEAFQEVLFVGPHILRDAVEKNGALRWNGRVVYNAVDVNALKTTRRRMNNGKVLGLVGIVPQRKRLDLALDILSDLRRFDREYTLRVKGKRPEEYDWMLARPDELSWYNEQYRRIEEDPSLQGAVVFDGHGDDMPEWYAGIDFVLSTSDFESFHFTIADGAAAGCSPVCLAWEGADEIYPRDWVYRDVREAVAGIRKGPADSIEVAKYAREKFDIEEISKTLLKAVQGNGKFA